MGRDDHNHHNARKNKARLPQTPVKDTAGAANDDLELANELGDRYKLEVTPGLGVTGVQRKDRGSRYDQAD